MAGHGNCEAHEEVLVLSHRWFCVREAWDADAAFVEGVGGCGREEDAPRFLGDGRLLLLLLVSEASAEGFKMARRSEVYLGMLALDKCACYGRGLGVGFPGRMIMTELGEEHILFLEM